MSTLTSKKLCYQSFVEECPAHKRMTTETQRLRELLRRTQAYIYSGPPRNPDHDSESVLSAQIRDAVENHTSETCERHICWACQATYAGPRAEGKCSRCASGADPVRAVAWVGFPADQPKPDYDVAYDDASKLPGHSYTAIYWQPPAQKANSGETFPESK